MSLFTDSPLEKMMMQKPRDRKEPLIQIPSEEITAKRCSSNRDKRGIGSHFRDTIIIPKERRKAE